MEGDGSELEGGREEGDLVRGVLGLEALDQLALLEDLKGRRLRRRPRQHRAASTKQKAAGSWWRVRLQDQPR